MQIFQFYRSYFYFFELNLKLMNFLFETCIKMLPSISKRIFFFSLINFYLIPFSSAVIAGLLVARALQGLPTASLFVANLLISSPPFFFFRIFAILFADLFAVRQITVRSEENRFAVSPIIPVKLSSSLESRSLSSSSLSRFLDGEF